MRPLNAGLKAAPESLDGIGMVNAFHILTAAMFHKSMRVTQPGEAAIRIIIN